jgi:hypothetical protein
MIEGLQRLSREIIQLKNSPYRRYLIKRNPFDHRLSLLLGQRGVGKTTTIVQYLLDFASDDFLSKDILYVPVDHFLVRETSIYSIAENFNMLGGKILALDEIHKYSNWSQELKSIYDTFPKLKLIASGSSALQIHKGSHDLARRAVKSHLFGLSFREYLELKHNFKFDALLLNDILENHIQLAYHVIKFCNQENKKIVPIFKEYLKSGYFPYSLEFPNENHYFLTLEQNLHTTIEADLAAIYSHLTGVSINKIKKLFAFIAKTVPFTPDWVKIKNILDIGDSRTLKAYFEFLENAGLIRSINRKNKKLNHLDSHSKIYLDNPNQIHALAFHEQNQGTLREVFFMNMLSVDHEICLAGKGDFLVDDKYLFEIGGQNKTLQQIKNETNAYLACDNIEAGAGVKIPLWLFGFLY